MIETVTQQNLSEYEAFLRAHPHGSVFQSARWAQQKPQWQFCAFLYRNAQGAITGTLSVLLRRLPILPQCVIYGCRGPVCDPDDTAAAAALAQALRQFAKARHACLVRLDPPFQEREPALLCLQQAGFLPRRGGGYLPACAKRSWMVPLAQDTLASLAQRYSEEHRRSVQLALQLGVEVRQGGAELLPDFMHLLQQEALRRSRVMQSQEYYAGLLALFSSRACLSLAYYENRPVAGALTLRDGAVLRCLQRTDDGDPTLHARYLLRTVLLQSALQQRLSLAEFPDLPANPDAPESRFCSGFGGYRFTYAGTQDYVPHPIAHFFLDLAASVVRYVQKKLYFFRLR